MNMRGQPRWLMLAFLCATVAASISLVLSQNADGAALNYVSDTVASSAPATTTSHTILFQISQAIPPSGRIVITPQSGQFTIPSGLDYLDADLATSSSLTGPFTDRTLAATPNAANDGITVTSGSSGSIAITLNSSFGIGLNTYVQIELGVVAAFGGTGDSGITNPSGTNTSYKISFETQDASSVLIDKGATLIAVVDQVTIIAAGGDAEPPVRSNGQPTGQLPTGTTQAQLSLNTDETADCKYSTVAGISYDSMPNTFSNSSSTAHSTNVGGLINGASYTFFVRCSDKAATPNKNTDDFIIAFSIGGSVPPPFPQGSGGNLPGTGAPFPPQNSPEVIVQGTAYPFAEVTILQDGVEKTKTKTDSLGKFEQAISVPSQGTYNFSVSARDTEGRSSGVITSSFTIVTNSRNVITFLLPPTLSFAKDSVGAGEPVLIAGQAQIGSTVEVWVYPQSRERDAERLAKKTEIKTEAGGKWKLTFDTASLGKDTYAVKARAVISPAQRSDFSRASYFGIGQAPAPDLCLRADINKDGRVNLVDFSILLFNWQTSNEPADINLDGRVNLTDFSVMLFCWSG